MKKIFMSVMILLCAVLLTWAEGAAFEGERIEINFKVGDEILYINGEDVKVEKPVVINGVTLVPLRVITEAFGAEVDWNGQQRSVTLSYSQVSIKLYIDNKEAYVDKNAVELLEAPRIINDRTMVPLRFIAENFGADVEYNEYTKQITVIKIKANAHSIKDYSLIIKKTTKEKVGDSYYGWSIDLTKNLELIYRSFNGNINIFAYSDTNDSIMLGILPQGERTIDSLLSSALVRLEYDYGFTLIRHEKNDNYARVVYRESPFTYEDRYYINDGKVYYINLSFEDYDNATYVTNQEVQNFLDSFSTKFVNDGRIEDLSDVTEDGFRPYRNKDLGFSIDVLANWIEMEFGEADYEESSIMAKFIDDLGNYVYITMYPYDEGLSLDDVVKMETDFIKKEYNPELYKLESIKDIEISGKKAKELLYEIKHDDRTEYMIYIFMVGENYKYNVGCLLTQDTYNDEKSKQKVLDMLHSFKFDEPDSEDIVYIEDSRFVDIAEDYITLENDRYMWSMKVPSTWIPWLDDNGDDLVEYINDGLYMSIKLTTLEGASFNDYINQFTDNLKGSSEESSISVDSIEDVVMKGVNAKKFVVLKKDSWGEYKQWIYTFDKNGNVYTVYFTIERLRASENNIKILERIWESMKFE